MGACLAVLGGTGQQGRGLALRFARAGLRVVVGSRDPDHAGRAVATWSSTEGVIEVADHAVAIAQADITILAVPFASLDVLLDQQRQHFRPGALVIDVTVPLTFRRGKPMLVDVPEGSAAEHVKARLPPHTRLAATFKTIPAHVLGELTQPLDCDEFVCGDSDEARSEAAALVAMLPAVRPIDVGSLERSRAIEHLTALAIAINRRHRIRDARFRVVGL